MSITTILTKVDVLQSGKLSKELKQAMLNLFHVMDKRASLSIRPAVTGIVPDAQASQTMLPGVAGLKTKAHGGNLKHPGRNIILCSQI